MFRNVVQPSPLTLYYSEGSNPLELFKFQSSKKDIIKLAVDEDISAKVHELISKDIKDTFLQCPVKNILGINLSQLVFIIKNLDLPLSIEIKVLDDKENMLCFGLSTFQKELKIYPEIALIKLSLDKGWNQIRIDLKELVNKFYHNKYKELLSIKFNGSFRLRKIFITEQMSFDESELPKEFRLYNK